MDIMKLSDLICMCFFEISPQDKLIVSISYITIIIYNLYNFGFHVFEKLCLIQIPIIPLKTIGK